MTDNTGCGWDHPAPFTQAITVTHADLDGFGHVNNRVYVRWQEEVSWAHSAALGLTIEDYARIGTGVIVRRNTVEYLAPAFAGEDLLAGTWIAGNDGKLRLDRRHQIIRPADGRTLFRGFTEYVCVDMATGRPRRMPEVFRTIYAMPEG